MKLQKANVQLTRGATFSGYRLTLYMGVNSDSGPDYPVLLESENDLYKYFNTHADDQSVNTLAFCLRLGYRVYAQRVNTISERSSRRKFIVDGESRFYSPLRSDYPETGFSFVEPTIVSDSQNIIDDTLYSAVISFNAPSTDISNNVIVSGNFLLIVPRSVMDPVTEKVVTMYERLVGSEVTEGTLDSYSSSEGHDVRLGTVLYSEFRDVVISFLKNNCGLEVTDLTENSIYVQSQNPIQSFQIVNDYAIGYEGYDLLNFEPSYTGLEDNYCRKLDEYKVCTLYSKYEDSLNDIEVSIVSSLGEYIVDVYRYNSENIVVYSESFTYSASPKSPDYIINLSTDSSLVDIEIHDNDSDLSGDYLLKGKDKIVTNTMYSDSLNGEDLSDLVADLVIDNSVSDQFNYIKALKSIFVTSILLTGFDFTNPEDKSIFVRTAIVCPDVMWRNTGKTLKGFTYLLYLLPLYSAGSDSSILRRTNLPEYYTENAIIIDRSDYSIELMGSNVSLDIPESKFPIKSAISVIAVLNYMSHANCTSESQFYNYLAEITSTVNDYLGTNTVVIANSVTILNYTLSASLNFYVDKQIILSYRVSATLVV